MVSFPSYWGKHPSAIIDLVTVNDSALVTAISNAPAGWEARLGALGFTKRSKSWMRLGTLSQTEFQYLSPSIDLIGFQSSDVVALDDYVDDGEALPPAIQNTILSLWQRQSAAVLVALSAEHGINYTRQQAWSVAEAAIAGGRSPETETLIGLALTKLARDGDMDQGVEAFAVQIGWQNLASSSAKKNHAVVLKAGSAVTWVDRDGVAHDGRCASNMRADAVGLWVYEGGPRWAAGYPVVAPSWISRAQLHYRGFAPDWLASDLVPTDKRAAVVEQTIPELELSHTFTPAVMSAIERVIYFTQFFPSSNWELAAERAQIAPDLVDDLRVIAQKLHQASRMYYPELPLSFALASDYQGIGLSIAVDVDPGTDTSLRTAFGGSISGYSLPESEADQELDIAKAARQLDKSLRVRRDILKQQGSQLAQRVEGGGDLFVTSRMFMNSSWMRVAHVYGASLTADSLLTLAASAIKHPDMLGEEARMKAHWDGGLAPTFNFVARLDTAQSVDSASLRVINHAVDVLSVENVLAVFAEAQSTTGVMQWPSAQQARYYSVSASDVGDKMNALVQLPGVSVVNAFEKYDSLAPEFSMPPRPMLETEAQALEVYVSLVENLQGHLTVESEMERLTAERLAKRWGLKDRFEQACLKIRHLPHKELTDAIEAAIVRETKGKYLNFTEATHARIRSAFVKQVAEGNSVHGLIFFMSPRTWWTVGVDWSEKALTESRMSLLGSEAVRLKNTGHYVGKPYVIDLISVVDSELCGLLNQPIGEVSVTKKQESAPSGDGRYEDTGTVKGFAIKDLRAMSVENLQSSALSMTEDQKKKYLTKDSLWPRKSMEELRDMGLPIKVALSFDLFWRGIPSSPLTAHTEHTFLFIKLLSAMRKTAEPILVAAAESRGGADECFKQYSEDMRRATTQLLENDFPEIRKHYPYKKQRIRGTGLYWGSFDPFFCNRHQTAMRDVTWDSVIKPKKASTTTRKSRVQRDALVRVGPDYREGKNVDGDDFIKTFMFSGVEYGNWTNQEERVKHLNFAYDSMMDFARVLGIDPAALSLGGRLGLCFGSRGHGGAGAANAHFEPANIAINLTRMSGDGSLAHEYGHAIANHYGRIATGRSDDLAELIGYPLAKAGEVGSPTKIGNALRDESLQAFYGLLTAIMRKPEEGADPKDLSSYTQQSDMLKAAIEYDQKRSDPYWATPAEMFARGMEMWFKATLEEQGERNDYLVANGKKFEGVYPSAEQLPRIQHFASAWLESLKTEVRAVEHPYLGKVDMPVLYTRMAANAPLNKQDLIDLAEVELDRLFGEVRPSLEVSDRMDAPGMYVTAANLMRLHADLADSGTFYHEAWHAAEQQLLCQQERVGINTFFAPGGAAAERVVAAMRECGFPDTVINDAQSDSREMTAYAFQLWSQGDLQLGDSRVREFERTKLFVDGVVEVGSLFTATDAEKLFQSFAQGRLASRISQNPDNDLTAGFDWRDEDYLVWQIDPASESRAGPRFG